MSAPLPPHLDPRGRHAGGSGRSGGGRSGASSAVTWVRPIGYTLGALLSITLVLLSGYLWYTFRDIENHVHRLPVALNQPPKEGKGPSAPAPKDIDGQDQNILIVGNDDRSNLSSAEIKQLHVAESGGSMATDTMMIVHVPADGSKATLISLPRDTWVHIAGHGYNRLNAAYVDGYLAAGNVSDDAKRTAGADLLIQTISDLTGLTINHYVQVSLLGFYDISNAIGGVTVDLCHAVDDTTAANHAAGLTGGSGLKLPKGKSTIKGVQALEFVRQRHFLPLGDLDRVRRQQYFLTAAFRKVASIGVIFELKDLGDALERDIYLDPTLNLIDLARQMEDLSANNINGKTIPTTPAVIEGQDVLTINKAQVQQFIGRAVGTIPSKPHSHHKHKHTAAIDSKCIN
jgi:LCP family protein required for cell wall assembly